MTPWKSHGNLIKIMAELNVLYKTTRGRNANPIKFYFCAMTNIVTKCKPRVAGSGPQPLDYMARVIYGIYGINEYYLQKTTDPNVKLI